MNTDTANELTLDQLDGMIQPMQTRLDDNNGHDAPADAHFYIVADLLAFSQRCISLANALNSLAHNTIGAARQRGTGEAARPAAGRQA